MADHGLLWYATTIVAAYMWLEGSKASSLLHKGELAAAAVIVGTIGGAWVTYLIACCLSMLE